MHVRPSWPGASLPRPVRALPVALAMLSAIGLGAALAGAGAATASAEIVEYPSYPTSFPSPTSPQQIVAGPDGNLWYTDGSKCVYRMLASGAGAGQETSFCVPTGVPTGADPGITGITAGPDGALWLTGYSDDYIGRVSTSGAITWYPAPGGGKIETTPFQLSRITVGSDGHLWFTMSGANRIGRLVPSQAVQETGNGFTLNTTGAVEPAAAGESIASGPGGNLWYTEPGSNAIGELSPASGLQLGAFPVPSGSPLGIAPGPQGDMWFTEGGSADRIGSITPAGQVTEFPMPAGVYDLWDIVAGPDGNLWFTYGAGATDAGVGCMTPAGNVTAYPAPTPGANPEGIAVGPDGAIWFTESNVAKIGRLSPVLCGTAPAGGPGPPVLSNLRETARTWREGRALAQISKKKLPLGTTFSFSLNESASVTFTFTESVSGRKAGKRCVAQTKRNKRRPRCTRTFRAGTLTFSAHGGANKVRFDGPIRAREKLKLGSYTLLVSATASGKHSTTGTLHFRIANG